ncbi:toll/interleukin-1 receptor domain-containing protein [Frankia sp. Mgl5]|uniref:toll/interleukin-1 receptor domain-containing protein n=1 Tax=Frankia sp. Mgl5 TaxID=2933793 RepID=UPI00200D3B4A|nr:toll/interleukin-1 receptor domain-containing protein [Frankia sp. Mgl5]MCK9928953.1 toll/interleukin-1 receptor domain-containing protein [Frankia sp. Mgl5]
MGPRTWDFFIFYTAADRRWAEWVAWQLEDAGPRVLIQAWDFVPGRTGCSAWSRGEVCPADGGVTVGSQPTLRLRRSGMPGRTGRRP